MIIILISITLFLNLPEFSFLCKEFSFSSFPKYISDSPPPIVPELLPPFDEFRLD